MFYILVITIAYTKVVVNGEDMNKFELVKEVLTAVGTFLLMFASYFFIAFLGGC
jgi:hypothetical protein